MLVPEIIPGLERRTYLLQQEFSQVVEKILCAGIGKEESI